MLEERLVKRGVSLKGVDYGTIEEATHNTVRQVVTIKVGISADKAREVNKLIKAKHPKGVGTQTQGDSVRVSAKKRDDLQAVIATLKATDLGIPSSSTTSASESATRRSCRRRRVSRLNQTGSRWAIWRATKADATSGVRVGFGRCPGRTPILHGHAVGEAWWSGPGRYRCEAAQATAATCRTPSVSGVAA